jgi:formiminoglutamase
LNSAIIVDKANDMELTIFFDRVDEQLYENIGDSDALANQISVHTHQFPNWQSAQIAIVGLQEERGNANNTGCQTGANAIRQALYRLKKHAKSPSIVDLGNLRNGMELEETYLRIKEVCGTLIEKGLFVILIGGSHDLTYGQYMAYESLDRMVSLTCVDSVVNIVPTDHWGRSGVHLLDIATHEHNFLFHLCHLGSQNFLNAPEVSDTMERLHFENLRLGQMRENLSDMEPLIRQADLLSFDLSSVKRSDAPGNKMAPVFGLTAEEACQLAWYAGLSDKLSSVGLYEYNPDLDKEGQTAFVMATMIWYLIDGYCHRKGDLNFDGQHFVRYMVGVSKDAQHTIVFYKSKLSEKWWMEVPYPSKKDSQELLNTLVPCNYSDYQTALNGELPNRWLLMHSKLF